MAKQKIILVSFEDDDGQLYNWLDYEPSDGKAADENPMPTIEEIADFLDGNAEGRNNHDFVGTHRLLSAMLFRRLGREVATEIMFEIAEYGGLDGASGLWHNGTAAFEDFGIADCWNEWSLDSDKASGRQG